MRRFFLCLVASTLFSCIAYAQTTFFVDASKVDNNGVGTSWTTAKRDLQSAINLAQVGDAVWVKAGIYKPTVLPVPSLSSDRDKAFLLKSGVSIFGGFTGTETSIYARNSQINPSILSGDIGVANDNTDNCYHVVLDLDAAFTDTLDGFTITQGNANGTSIESIFGFNIKQFAGGGIVNSNSSRLIQHCNIVENRAGNNVEGYGAGIYSETGFNFYVGCNFNRNIHNINGTLNNGGAMYIESTIGVRVENCAFSENEAGSGAGLYIMNSSPVINFCTFTKNVAVYEGAGIYYSSTSRGILDASILWNNTTANLTDANREEIFSANTNISDQVYITKCLVRDATGSPLSVQNTIVLSFIINNNPLFINSNDLNGVDNIFLTTDDGLQLSCNSPAIGLDLTPILYTDILGSPRSFPIDLGAYESGHLDIARANLPTADFTVVQLLQNPNGISHYSDCNNEVLAIQTGGSYNLSNMVTSTVWIEPTQPRQFVKRHYEITPISNATSSTGRVTLYFKQSEFDAYNNQVPAPALKLPINSSDIIRKQNLVIEKRGGISNDFSGLPYSYTGTVTNIDPVDANIVWNAVAARWEVSFDVTGFSGFFVKTQASVLPLRLLSFSAVVDGNCTKIQWQTADEINTKLFEIERSSSNVFDKINSTPALGSGNNFYSYNDCKQFDGRMYYRLKIIDADGSFSYSQIISVQNKTSVSVNVFPNPTNDFITINIYNTRLLNTNMHVVDTKGTTLIHQKLNDFTMQINIKEFATGVYIIRFDDGTNYRIIKNK